ncbi:MAG: hypothetical protein U0T69_03125 [Chitinophagales bacterium]
MNTNLDSVFVKIDSSDIIRKKIETERDSFELSLKDSALINLKVKSNKYIGHGEELGLLKNRGIRAYFNKHEDGFYDIDKLKTTEFKITYKKNDTIIFNDSILLVVKDSKFRKYNHKYDVFYDAENVNFLGVYKIDGNYFWGTDGGGLPYWQSDTIILSLNKSKNLLPKSAYFNLYSPNIYHSVLYQSHDKKYIFLCMLNSDGAGSYEVYFVFKNNRYIGRIVINGEC